MADTYNAGAIEATADLDRDPFLAGLRECVAEGRKFAGQKFSAKAEIETRAARAQLRQLKAEADKVAATRIDIKARVDIGNAEARIAALRASLAALRAEQDKADSRRPPPGPDPDVARARADAARARADADTAAARARADAARARADAAAEARRAAQARADAAQAKADSDAAIQRARERKARDDADAARIRRDEVAARAAAAAAARANPPTPPGGGGGSGGGGGRGPLDDPEKQLGLLRVGIEQLVPPLIPLASGLLGIASGFVGLGVAGVAAFAGIKKEMKDGTELGQAYAGQIRVLKDTVGELTKTGAQSVYAGFDAATTNLAARMPALNAELATSGKNLGDIGAHLSDGLVGGLQTFFPLIHEAEGYIDQLAQRFDSWATGKGGANFAQTLSEDMRHAIPAIESLATTVTRLFSAFHPVGVGMLDTITTLAESLNQIDPHVLQVAATAYIAFRSAVAVTSGINAASLALRRYAAASAAAGAGGAAGRLGGVAGYASRAMGVIVPYAAAIVGTAVALNAAAAATDSWRTSTDRAKSLTSNSLAGARSILMSPLSGNLDGLYQARDDYNASRRREQQMKDAQAALDAVGAQGRLRALNDQAGVRNVAGARVDQYADQMRDNGNAAAIYASKLQVTEIRVSALRTAQRDLAAAGQTGSATYKSQARDLANLETQLDKTGAGYVRTQAKMKALADNRRIQEAAATANQDRADRISTGYATNNRHTIDQSLQTTWRATDSLGVVAGGEALAKYQTSIAGAIKAEQKWTTVKGDATVTVRGQKYALDAYNKALVQSNGDVTAAQGILMGHSEALAQDKDRAEFAAVMQQRLSAAMGAASNKYSLTDQQLALYSATVGVTAEQLAKGEMSQDQFVAAIGRAKGAIDNGNTATMAWVSALQQFQSGADTAASRGQLLAAAMISFQGPAISYGVAGAQAADANQKMVDAFNQADKSIINLKTGFIDYHNAGALPVLSAMQSLQTQAANFAAVTYQNEVATKGHARAAKDAADVFRNDTTKALVAEADQLGLTRVQAQKLAERYFNWPKDAKTQIEALGVQGTNKLLNGLGQQLSYLTGRPWTFGVQGNGITSATDDVRRLKSELEGIATTYTTTVKVGKGGGSAGGTTASAAGNIVYAYAAGGMNEAHVPQIAPRTTSGVRVWAEPETQGEAYIPLANDWRRPRARSIAAETVSRLGGAAYFEAGGFTGVTGTGSMGGGTSSGGGGDGGAAARKKRAAELKAMMAAYGSLTKNHIVTESVKQLDKHSSDTLTAWAASVLTAAEKARDAHVPGASKLVKRIKDDNHDLKKAIDARQKLIDQKAQADAGVRETKSKMTDTRNSVRDTVAGAFDVSSDGNGYKYGIRASLDQDVKDAQKFSTLRAQAVKLGLDPKLLAKLTADGPKAAGANLEAIVSGGKSYVSGLNSQYNKLYALGGSLGTTQANETYGKELADRQKKANDIANKVAHATTSMNNELRGLRRDVATLARDTLEAARQRGGR